MILASSETAKKNEHGNNFLLITTSTETDNKDLNIANFYSRTLIIIVGDRQNNISVPLYARICLPLLKFLIFITTQHCRSALVCSKGLRPLHTTSVHGP